MQAPMIIGVDFDNTIVSYDELMRVIARDWELIRDATVVTKRQIRDAIRILPDGEITWQRLQIAAYGTRIGEALPAEGVKEFFLRCKQAAIPVRIVSHKTTYPNLGDEPKVNLRTAALGWLEQHGFVCADGLGVDRRDVYFESTRAEKIARIAQLGVTHFIDDLQETFDEPDFPPHVEKILYSSEGCARCEGITRISSWADIRDHVRRGAEPAFQARSRAR